MYEVNFLGFPIEIHECVDGNWKHDTIFIYSTNRIIEKRDIHAILQFLYDEGYIKDRRTKYIIVDSEAHDKKKPKS
tara:strand:- start:690 stop:917 length:228 start_codon:yes stop_codon:yes gene_type:complete